MTIVGKVKSKRLKEGLSQRALEAVCGVSHSSIARAERGEGGFTAINEYKLRQWLGGNADPKYETPKRLRDIDHQFIVEINRLEERVRDLERVVSELVTRKMES